MRLSIIGNKWGDILTNDRVKVFINDQEVKGIQQVQFDADASEGVGIPIVTLKFVPKSIHIEGNFQTGKKYVDGLTFEHGSKSLWVSREGIEDLLMGRKKTVPTVGNLLEMKVSPNYVTADMEEREE